MRRSGGFKNTLLHHRLVAPCPQLHTLLHHRLVAPCPQLRRRGRAAAWGPCRPRLMGDLWESTAGCHRWQSRGLGTVVVGEGMGIVPRLREARWNDNMDLLCVYIVQIELKQHPSQKRTCGTCALTTAVRRLQRADGVHGKPCWVVKRGHGGAGVGWTRGGEGAGGRGGGDTSRPYVDPH